MRWTRVALVWLCLPRLPNSPPAVCEETLLWRISYDVAFKSDCIANARFSNFFIDVIPSSMIRSDMADATALTMSFLVLCSLLRLLDPCVH